jgi:PAS domain S-box-containing protein
MIVGLFFVRAINARLESDVKAADLAMARSIAQEIGLNLTNARYAAQELARYVHYGENDQINLEEIYSEFTGLQSAINPISLLDDWWIIDNQTPIALDVVPSEAFPSRNYLQRGVLNRPSISSGWRSSTTQRPVATSVIPLWDELGNITSVVVSNIRLEVLSSVLKEIVDEYQTDAGYEYDVIVVDGSRRIVAHPNPSMILRSTSYLPIEVTMDALRGQPGSFVYWQPGEDDVLYSYAPIPGTNWGVIINRPTAVAFATANAFTRSMLIVVTVFLGVGLFFWFGLSIQVMRPLEKLAVYSQSISGNGVLSGNQRKELTSLANRADQVGHLTDTLVKMEADIEARLNELGTLLQTSAAVVSTLENQAVLDRILQQVERLLDVEMSAIVALDRLDGIFHTQASRGITKEHATQLTVNPNDHETMILRALRNRAPVQIDDTEADHSFPELRQQAREAGYRSLLAIPLQTLYAPPSALLVFRAEPYFFSDREISLLTSFANHAAMAIENATLYARSDMRLQEQTQRLEALIQSLKDGLILENLDGKIVYANRQISLLVKRPIDEIVGSPVDDLINLLLIDVDEADRVREHIQSNLDQTDLTATEFDIKRRGRKLNLRIQLFKVTDAQGYLIGRGRIFYDVTADRELDHMKSRLISTVSHELRTPLASIKGYATTLLADDVEWDLASQREFLEIISSETDRLSAMVTDLLDLSKIEAGSLTINRSEAYLEEIVSLASQRSYPRPDGRLRVNIPPNLPVLQIDKRLIEAVFRNLIENAIKYAGEDSPITITAELKNEDLVVYVQDEGPGVPVQYQERIFESFFRPQESSLQRPSGFGLGLTICKGFIESHGGRIWIEPCSVGACVAFSLPLNDG